MELTHIFNLFVWLVCLRGFLRAQTPNDCYSGQVIGDNRRIASGGEQFTRNEQPDSTVIILDTGTGQGSNPVSGDVSYESPCCGVVKRWGVDAQNYPGGEVKLQIWRPQGNDKYMLVGEEDFVFSSTKNGPSYVDPTHDILIQVGDKLGFTGDLLEYKKSNGFDGILAGTVLRADGLGGTAGPQVQSTYDLNIEHPDADDNTTPEMIAWAFDAVLKKRDAVPGCEIVFAQTSFNEDVPVGTLLGTISTTSHGDDTIFDYEYALTSIGGLPISVDKKTGVITTSGNLTATPPSQIYTVSGKTIEAICFKHGLCSADLTINWINKPISITSLPATTHLLESTEKATIINLIETEDANRKAFVDRNPTCSVIQTLPAMPGGTGFSTTANFLSTKFNLQYDGSPALDALTLPVIRVVCECEDEYGSTATATLTVSVDKNTAPTVTNTPDASGKICGSENAMNIKKFDPVFYLGITDTEGDTVTVKFTKKDAKSPFAWDSSINAIYATEDLETLQIAEHDFTLEVSDKWNKNSPSVYDVCIKLTGLNVVPVFSDCPKTISESENGPVGKAIFTAGVTDSNKLIDHQVHTFSMNVDPLVFEPSFTLDTTTGEIIRTADGIGNNYEKANALLKGGCINFELAVTDGIHYAAQNCDVCLHITDLNDAPVLAVKNQAITVNEQGTGGILPPINTKFVDEDAGETHKFKILSGNGDGYFDIDTATGQLNLVKSCDRDAGCPAKVELVIEVEDARGLTDSMKVTITLNDINDNAPIFNTTACVVTITNGTATNSILTTLSATDPDQDQNGLFTYSVAGIGYGSQYFRIDSTGNLRLFKKFDFKQSTNFIITVSAKDRGNPPLESFKQCTVNFIKNKTVSSSKVDKPQPCFFCTEGGIALFTMFMMIVAVVMAMIFYILWKCCLKEPLLRLFKTIGKPRKPHGFRRQRIKEERRPPTPVTPLTPLPPPRRTEEVSVIQFKRKPRTPPAPPQTVRFGYWNEKDSELDGKNPGPSKTFQPF